MGGTGSTHGRDENAHKIFIRLEGMILCGRPGHI